MMDKRRNLRFNSWAQLGLVLFIAILANTWMSRRFFRMDLTTDGVHSLDLVTRSLVHRLDKPMLAKVYFTGDLQAPYNNHEQTLLDTLEELQAYSKGLLEVQAVDPTGNQALEAEARRFGVQPIDYRYKSESRSELRKVFMGLALVYGDRQEVLPAITQTATLEYDLARSLRNLVTDDARKQLGYTTGHGEPDLGRGGGPLEHLRNGITENVDLVPVGLGGGGTIPEDIDALLVVGPQKQMDERSLYQLDQFLMRGGGLAVFLTSTRGDLRSGRPQQVKHGMNDLLSYYGISMGHDLVIDRKRNGVMRFPVRQGRYMLQMPVNYPLLPRVMQVARTSPIVGPIKSLLFPFSSSIQLQDPLPDEVHATVLASNNPTSTRVKNISNVLPGALKEPLPDEEAGSWPMLVALTGSWSSFYAGKEIPSPSRPSDNSTDAPAAQHLTQSSSTRLVVGGSADFVANNIPFMLNLVDWLVQDESLIRIRSKMTAIAPLEPLDAEKATVLKAVNLLGGTVLLLIFGIARRTLRATPAQPTRSIESMMDIAQRLQLNERDTPTDPGVERVSTQVTAEEQPPFATTLKAAPTSTLPAQEPQKRMKWSLADEIPDSDSGEELTPAQQATSRKRAQQARAAMEELREIGERIDAGKPLVHDQNTEGTASTPDTPAPPEIPDPASDGDPTAAIDEDQLNQISVLTRMAAPVEEDEKPTRPQRPTRTKKSTWKRSKAKKTPAKGGEE